MTEALNELNNELDELKSELSIVNKHLDNKKKLHNDFFKTLMQQKDELEKLINEVEIEIEIELNSTKNTQDGSDNRDSIKTT